MSPFLVTVVLHPTKKQKDEDGAVPQVIVPSQAVMAKSENHASMKAVRLVPEEHADKDDRLEVYVLPFRRCQAG